MLLTRFAQIEYSEMFRPINQDYGSFYHRQHTPPCIPDALKEKLYRRHERFTNLLVIQPFYPHSQEEKVFPQCNTQTVTTTDRRESSTICKTENELIIDFLKQIQQRLEGLIDPSDYHDVFKCAKILVIELLNKEPSLSAENVIQRVIAMMNTPFCNYSSKIN